MSTTDQAFIRAYGGPAKLGKPSVRALPLASLPHTHALESNADRQTPPNSATTKTWIAHSENYNRFASVVEVGPESVRLVPAAQIGCIEIGIGSTVPAPHANFALRHALNRSPLKISGDVPSTTREFEPHTIRAEFDRSPKAKLSSFTQSATPANVESEPLKPALEIDAVCWPAICDKLFDQQHNLFENLAGEVLRIGNQGQRVIAISGAERNEGRTTLALCLARELASKCKIAMVDADFESPCIAKQLRIGVDCGWAAVLHGDARLADAMIESIQDELVLLPLERALLRDSLPRSSEIGPTLQHLAEQFEIVLVDAGPNTCDSPLDHWLCQGGNGVDSIILTRRAGRRGNAHLSEICDRFSGTPVLGIAETFIESETTSSLKLS